VTVQRRERVEALLARARALDPSERERFLDQECENDTELRDEIARLLAGEGVAPDFLDPLGAAAVEATLRALTLDYTGQQLGDFQLEQTIGRGATGIVHQAIQLSVNRTVAVKILAPLMVSNAERLERFRREAYSQARLRHPYVVAAFYFGNEGGVPYLAMERVQGRSLRDRMADERKRRAQPDAAQSKPQFDPFDPRTAAELMAKVATALDYCHRQGVIHRDIKPNNILIDERLDPRLIDFGIARDQSLETLTRSGDISGTPYYMSPEQARARKRHVSHRTDIYSSGAVLYEMLTGVPPFPGIDSLAVLHSICHDELRPVRSIDPSVPRALELICHKAMMKDPERRYRTAAELAEDLGSFLAGRAVQARGPSIARRVETISRRHPRLASVAAILLVLVGIIAIERSIVPVLARDYSKHRSKVADGNSPLGLFEKYVDTLPEAEKAPAYKRAVDIILDSPVFQQVPPDDNK
jgi:serine/threonine protein kinase